MTMMGLPAKGSFAVTGQRQTTAQVPGTNGFVQGIEVSFVTGWNVTGAVFIPVANYSTATVQAAITARVAQLDEVSQLGNTGR